MLRLLRRHPPARGALRVDRRRIYLLPTRQGVLFLAVCLLLVLAAIHYGNSLAFLLAFLLGGILANAMWMTHAQLLGLTLRPLTAEPVHAGEEVRIPFEACNPGNHPRPELSLAALDAPGTRFALPPGSCIQVVLSYPATRRGWLTIPRYRLDTRFPLGLFQAWSWLRFEHRILVYPAIERRPLPPETVDPVPGPWETASKHPGDEDFDHLRDYRPGDPASRISWRHLARGRDLQSKQFVSGHRQELWFDWALVPDHDPERRLSILAGWVLQGEENGLRYGLRLPDLEIPPGRGAAHRHRCLEALALYGAEK